MQPNAPSSIPSIPIPVQSPHATNEPHRHPRHQPPDPRPRRPHFGQLIAEPAFVLIGHGPSSATSGTRRWRDSRSAPPSCSPWWDYACSWPTAPPARSATSSAPDAAAKGSKPGSTGCGWPLSSAPWPHWSSSWPPNRCAGPWARAATCSTTPTAYLQAVAFGMPGMMLVYAANGIFRGLQKVRITLAAAVCGAVVNTVLDVLFVFGFDWGVTGSGVATLIAQWVHGAVPGRAGAAVGAGGRRGLAATAARHPRQRQRRPPCCSSARWRCAPAWWPPSWRPRRWARRCWRPINR